MTIGKRILKKRKERGLTQYQLAKQLNVNIKTVKDWENDVSCPVAGTIIKLCDLLNMSSDYLLGLRHDDPIYVDGLSMKEKLFVRSIVQLIKNNQGLYL